MTQIIGMVLNADNKDVKDGTVTAADDHLSMSLPPDRASLALFFMASDIGTWGPGVKNERNVRKVRRNVTLAFLLSLLAL